MKKIYFLIASALLLSNVVSAQYYYLKISGTGSNPGGLNVDAEQPGAAGWSSILASTSTDAWSPDQTIPFTFTFNGNNFTSFKASNSGVLTFTTSATTVPSTTPAGLPDAAIPDNSICAWGLNLSGGNDEIVTKTFGTAPNRQFWVQWASASSAGLGGGSSWAYWGIVLEETSNKVYVVDMRNYSSAGQNVALSVGLQYDASSALMVTGSPALGSDNVSTGGSVSDQSDNTYYEFTAGTQPANDIAVTGVDMPTYHRVNTGNVDVKATILNKGSDPVTSLDVSYTISGNTVSGTISGLNIASGAAMEVTHPTPWNPTTEGDFDIDVDVTQVNGAADANTADNQGSDMTIVHDGGQRKPLYEIFTSSTCPPCKPGNENFDAVMANYTDQDVTLKYQQDFPGAGDPYATAETVSRRGDYYSINSIPRMEINGGWDGNASAFTTTLHEETYQVPAFMTVYAEYIVDVSNQKVDVCVDLTSQRDYGNVTLQMAIFEKETFQNVESNGETVFEHVVKKMLPNQNGQSVTLNDGSTERVCESHTFQGNFRLPNDAGDPINHATEHSIEEFTDLGVAVWVQNDADKEVLQSEYAVAVNEFTGIIEASAKNLPIKAFPNPANTTLTLDVSTMEYATSEAKVQMIDVTGRTVILQEADLLSGNIMLDVSELKAGSYFVVVNVGNDVYRQNVVIKH